MLPSTPSPSPDWLRVRVTTKVWLVWVTTVASMIFIWWLFRGGCPFFAWGWLFVNYVLLDSYQAHRIAGTDQGIELRTIWWREVVGWGEISSLDARPAYWSKDILLMNRDDPPWKVVISTPRRKLSVRSRRSMAEAMRAEFERMRASNQKE